MASFNKVLLLGNLTRDPELRHTPTGSPVAEFGLAVNEIYKNKAGETVEQTCFAEIVVWGRQAETCDEFLNKGSTALIEGKLQFEQWETQQGEKRNKLKVRADRVQFIGSPSSSPSGDDSKNSSSPSGGDLDVPPF